MNKPRAVEGTLAKCGWCLYFTRDERDIRDKKDGVCEIVECRVSAISKGCKHFNGDSDEGTFN